MAAKKTTTPKTVSLDGKNTIYIYGVMSRKPTTIYLRLSENYRYPKGTKWLQFTLNREGYEADGVRSTADVKFHCKVASEKGIKVSTSTLPLGFTSAWVR